MDDTKNPHDAAVEGLEELGLSTYAARTFVALVALGSGSARDVSQVADVPRTRVYDAAQELRDRGIVDDKHGSPRTFWPVSPETAVTAFEREFQEHASTLRSGLESIGPDREREEQRGVWTVEGRDAVTDRTLAFFESAREEIVYLTVESVLDEDVLDGLAAAADRGVSVRIAGLSDAVEERVRERVPDAEEFDSLWARVDPPTGRLLLVDREKTLVSVLLEDDDGHRGGETAIWGSGETNSLVAVLEAIFTWQLDSDPSTDGAGASGATGEQEGG